MSSEFGFRVCRVCKTPKVLLPKGIVMTSLIDGNGKAAEIFKLLSGIDIAVEGNFEALICEVCSKEVTEAYAVRLKILKADATYFRVQRIKELKRIQSALVDFNRTAATGNTTLVDFNETATSGNTTTLTLLERTSANKTMQNEYDDPTSNSDDGFDFDLTETDADVTTLTILQESSFDEFENEKVNLLSSTKVDGEFKDQEVENISEITTERSLALNKTTTTIRRQQNVSILTIQLQRKPKQQEQKGDTQCSICNKRFYSHHYLRVHVESVHQKIKNFSCDHCPKKFYYKIHLQVHVKIPNFELKRYQCTVKNCGKFLRSKTILKFHVESVHQKIKNFSCDHCPNRFYNKYNLKQHIQVHMKKAKSRCSSGIVQRYQCQIEDCKASFKYISWLKAHELTHSCRPAFWRKRF